MKECPGQTLDAAGASDCSQRPPALQSNQLLSSKVGKERPEGWDVRQLVESLTLSIRLDVIPVLQMVAMLVTLAYFLIFVCF